jgi:hypothetical protein
MVNNEEVMTILMSFNIENDKQINIVVTLRSDDSEMKIMASIMKMLPMKPLKR